MNIIKSDKPNTKVRGSGGDQLDYLPARRLKLPVDKQKILKKGVVSEDKKDQIVSEIRWKLPKKHLIKSDMMLLDLVTNQDWDRPICFAVSVSPGAFIGLKQYFQLEGLVYRFVPIKSEVERGRVKNINTDVMYEHVVNDFRWGNVSDTGKYMDENLRRMAMNLRIQVNQLAGSLIKEGKADSAVEVLDMCVEALPPYNVPYNMVMLRTAEIYYQAGHPDKGRPIAKRIFNMYADEVDYMMRVRNNYPGMFRSYQRDFRQAVRGILPRVMQIGQNFEDEQLLNEVRPQFNALRQNVSGGMQPRTQ
jgi:hypothetical protein